MSYPNPRTGFHHNYKAASVTSSTGRHSPVVRIGDLSVCSIEMGSAWTNATLSIYGSVNSTSTSDQVQLFGSTAAGTRGSGTQVAATYVTTDNRILSIDPGLTKGVQYVMLKSSATQASTRLVKLGLG